MKLAQDLRPGDVIEFAEHGSYMRRQITTVDLVKRFEEHKVTEFVNVHGRTVILRRFSWGEPVRIFQKEG